MSLVRLNLAGEEKLFGVTNISDLLNELSLSSDGRGIAVAVNDAVVSKSRWREHELRNGDKVEIVKAVQGG